MTSYEQELREAYEVALDLLKKRLKRECDLSHRVLEKLTFAGDLSSLGVDESGIEATLEDLISFSRELDAIHSNEIVSSVNQLQRLRTKIESEANGDEPDPTFGVKNNDFVETQS